MQRLAPDEGSTPDCPFTPQVEGSLRRLARRTAGRSSTKRAPVELGSTDSESTTPEPRKSRIGPVDHLDSACRGETGWRERSVGYCNSYYVRLQCEGDLPSLLRRLGRALAGARSVLPTPVIGRRATATCHRARPVSREFSSRERFFSRASPAGSCVVHYPVTRDRVPGASRFHPSPGTRVASRTRSCTIEVARFDTRDART
jgi:hypothetical protein